MFSLSLSFCRLFIDSIDSIIASLSHLPIRKRVGVKIRYCYSSSIPTTTVENADDMLGYDMSKPQNQFTLPFYYYT